MHVGQGHRLGVPKVTPAFLASGSAAGDDYGQIHVIMQVWVTHTASIQIQRVIQQRSIAFRRVLQLFDKLRKQREVKGIDLRDFGKLLRIAAIVRQRMMRLGDADFRIGPITCLTGQLERDYACDVALQSKDL